jgi:hypothetical protein
LPNRYRAVFVGLANDRSDGDGEPLPPGERNYLELYGVPPSLSVMRKRFVEDGARTCESTVDTAKLLAVDSIETWGKTTEKKESAKHHFRGMRLESAQKKVARIHAGRAVRQGSALRPRGEGAPAYEAERAAFAEVEKRLICEGLLDAGKHKDGSYDGPMRNAALDFQQKNAVFAQADLTRGTLEAMARPLLQNDFLALRRVLAERAAHAGRIIEDGSAIEAMPPAKRTARASNPRTRTRPARMCRFPIWWGRPRMRPWRAWGLTTPEDALAFFRRHPEGDFRFARGRALSRLPEYYGPHMDLVAEIDRGDVWYDFPFNDKGVRMPQPRERFPSFTLFVKWRGEKVPLANWRTTIGGWRTEVAADGEEYYRYKDSDVGARVWRHIVAAPVWLPPTSAPVGAMVKTKYVAGAYPKVVNYDETGPGYLSAYGLVAGIHEQLRRHGAELAYFDNGIRTHGSFDYLSLRGRFSHGCHRLYNNLAVRLFSFVLGHRKAKVLGPMALGFRRTFYWEGEVYDMRLPTRGFYFQLEPPLPIETLKGNDQGQAQAAHHRLRAQARREVRRWQASGGVERAREQGRRWPMTSRRHWLAALVLLCGCSRPSSPAAAGCASRCRATPTTAARQAKRSAGRAQATPEGSKESPKEAPKIDDEDLKTEEREANPYSETVNLKLSVTPQVKALVTWGAKQIARLAPGSMDAEISRPRGSGPVDLEIKAEDSCPITRGSTPIAATRSTFASIASKRRRGLLGYKRSDEKKTPEKNK